ncbi:DUF3951 domain-containing protein, partial [Bacillus sp. SS-TM]
MTLPVQGYFFFLTIVILVIIGFYKLFIKKKRITSFY